MANPRQRKKQKNPQMKAKRMKQTKKPAIPNIDVIKNNWDKKLTLQQNYEKLGLAARLNGGTDGKGNNFMNSLPRPELTDEQMENMDAKTISRIMGPGFGVVERDEQGNITKVTVADDDDFLDTPLPPAPAKTDVVRELERIASRTYETHKHYSENQMKHAEKLIAKHGSNYEAMFRDMKLNTWQETVGQIRKKCEAFNKIQQEKIQQASAQNQDE